MMYRYKTHSYDLSTYGRFGESRLDTTDAWDIGAGDTAVQSRVW